MATTVIVKVEVQRTPFPARNLNQDASNEHGGRLDVNYKMKVLRTYGKNNVARKVDEANRITSNTGVRLNSKAEFHQPSLPRLEIHRGRNTQ